MAKPTILCVEDEPDFLAHIAEFLEHENYHVTTATNGADGLQQFLQHRPDLVLCDIQMPTMTGFEMLEELNHNHADLASQTPFIFLSAYGDKHHHLKAKHLGCDDFLFKPVDFELLLATLQSRLNKWHRIGHCYEQSASQFQSQMLNILTHNMKEPLFSLIGYAEIMDGASISEMQRYKRRMDSIARDHLNQTQCLMDTIALGMNQYRAALAPCNAGSLLWEAAIAAMGLEKSQQIEIWGNHKQQHCTVEIDQVLCQKALRELVMMVHRYSRICPMLRCEVSPNGRIDLMIASGEARLAHAANWRLLNEEDTFRQHEPVMQSCGVFVMFARAVALYHESELWMDTTNPLDPAIRWRFAAGR